MYNDEVEIGKLMSAWTPREGLIEFRLRKSKSKYIGTSRVNTRGEIFKVLGNIDILSGNKYSHFLIEFEDGTRLVSSRAITGFIKNPNTPSVWSVGFLGQGDYTHHTHTKEYATWQSMLQRCYDIRYHKKKPTYKGCSVDTRWHNFQNFCKDIIELGGYKTWKENTIPLAWQLDKDIKIKGNKVYSKDTCMFVTFEENSRYENKDMTRAIESSKKACITGKTYRATNILTGEEKEFTNQSEFARNNSLHPSAIHECLAGNRNYTGDWIFETLEDKDS